MIINGKDLVALKPIHPMFQKKLNHTTGWGMKTSWGLTEVGYDVRLDQDVWFFPGRRFVLASTIEHFDVPNHLRGKVENKSTLARMGVDASRTTNLEPGWRGHLTLELTYSRLRPLKLYRGMGIATIVFEELLNPAQYKGSYQDQPRGPIKARI